jgi:hypothetical protein
VTDHFSRKLLLCKGLPSTDGDAVRAAFRKLFRELGLPEAIRTDNGAPFATRGLHGLGVLAVWWMRLGIVHQRSRPGSPQDNGQHERMHRDLKREATRPPAASMRAQQYKLNLFRHRYNDERPHEALDGAVPADLWTPSPRPYPEGGPRPPQYPLNLEIRRVSSAGAFRLNAHQVFLSTALAGHDIALEEIEDGLWNIVFYRTLLGRFDERRQSIFA